MLLYADFSPRAVSVEFAQPELNVQNGVLKAMSFLFEYIGEMGKDYVRFRNSTAESPKLDSHYTRQVYAVTPLLEDALMDRDPVHRQIASNVVKHMTLGVAGLGREDALVHLLNYVCEF